MKKILILPIAVWFILIFLSLYWNLTKSQENQFQTALQAARSFYAQVEITRDWNSEHGGVYVPITKKTPPNQDLDEELRNIPVNKEITLTKVNPAYMTRQLSELATATHNVRFHLTSLNPIRPANKPTPREEQALAMFEQGKQEVGEFVQSGNSRNFFYMAPLTTTDSCLPCHQQQGYKEGDVRGGISVTLPFTPDSTTRGIIISHLLMAILGAAGILIGGSKLHAAYERVRHQAVIDALTGIPNRLGFTERIFVEYHRSRRQKEPLSILMCDIDNFKGYNDTYGHGMGDACLTRVATTIQESLKRPGDFCARYGGEEFIILLPNTSPNGAINVANTLLHNVVALDLAHTASPPLHRVTISIGVTTTHSDGSYLPYEHWIKQADSALYRAKENGRNRYEVFEDSTEKI